MSVGTTPDNRPGPYHLPKPMRRRDRAGSQPVDLQGANGADRPNTMRWLRSGDQTDTRSRIRSLVGLSHAQTGLTTLWYVHGEDTTACHRLMNGWRGETQLVAVLSQQYHPRVFICEFLNSTKG